MTDREMSQAVKEYLSEVPKVHRLIRRMESAINSLRSSLTGQRYDLAERVQHCGDRSAAEEAFAQISQLETNIQDEIMRLTAWQLDTMVRIARVNNLDQRNVLIARYIENKRWERIADEIPLSMSRVFEIHGEALLAFAKKNPDVLKRPE